MSDYIEANATEDANATINSKLRQVFDGRIVRKDLTKKIKEGANVPVYVLEFLLSMLSIMWTSMRTGAISKPTVRCVSSVMKFARNTDCL